jgi:hypothetical protein
MPDRNPTTVLTVLQIVVKQILQANSLKKTLLYGNGQNLQCSDLFLENGECCPVMSVNFKSKAPL